MRLSILIPVYNERTVVERSLANVLAAPIPESMERELIIVDDCSTDGTSEILERLAAAEPRIRLIIKKVNEGKGAAVRTALQHASGDFCVVQDADLEYDPSEYPILLRPLLAGHADAVFGSRYLAGEQTRVLPFWHSMINKFLTVLSNMFCNLNLTDMETCYKVFRTDLLKSIPIRSNRFGFEPEITMKAAKRKLRIYEVPISYHGRTYEEGKKIGWKDGVKALGVILHFWLIDDLYVEPYGRAFLNNLAGTPQYVSWLTSLLRPHLGDTVLELGAGIGNVSGRLMSRRLHYVACEKDPLYLHALKNRFLRTPNVSVLKLDPEQPTDFQPAGGPFDTVLCVNVLEYVVDPAAVIDSAAGVLGPTGSLVILAPYGPGLFGSMDRTLGHKRRFAKRELRALLEKHGFTVTEMHQMNKIGMPAWWFYGKLLQRRQIGKVALKIFDKTVWFWRRVDGLIPWPGLSIVVVAKKESRMPEAFRFHQATCNEMYEKRPFGEVCQNIRRIGYTGIEISPFTLADRPRDITPAQRLGYRDTIQSEGLTFVGLHWLMVSPKGLHVTTPDNALRQRSWEHIVDLIDLCADLGDNGVMVFGSPKQRCAVDGLTPAEAARNYTAGLAQVAPHAQQRGVTILVEALPIGQCNVITTLAEAVGIVKEIDSPAVRTMFDTHNAVDEAEPHAVLVDRYFPLIRHVHINEMDGRHPGTGDYDFKSILQVLRNRAYQHWISLEVFDFAGGADTIAADSLRFMEKQIAQIEA